MQAQLTTPSFPPYDYVWTTDFSEEPTRDRGSSMTVMGSPTPAGSGPQVYTNVHAKVIDAFGQIAEASAPAKYQAQSKKHQRSSGSRTVTRIVASIILIFGAIVGFFLFAPTPRLSGPAEVNLGGMLHLHGSGFIGGGNVTLSLDGEALALSGNHSRSADSLHNRELFLSLAQLAPNGTILVDSSGDFDATIQISAILLLGTHTILASEAVIGIDVRSADLKFKVIQQQTPAVPPKLAANVTTINANTDPNCSYGANNGWTCSVSVMSDSSNQGSLDWSASRSGTGFSPSQGTLSPGQATPVTVFVSAKTICPTQIDLVFAGPTNTVHVTWSCASPTLSVTPNGLGPGNCTSASGTVFLGWDCIVILSDDEGGANWSASSSNSRDGVTFTPARDTVYPGGEQVTIHVPGCLGSDSFNFAGPGNTAAVKWQCIVTS